MTEDLPVVPVDGTVTSASDAIVAQVGELGALQATVRSLSEQLRRETIIAGRAKRDELDLRRQLSKALARVKSLEEVPVSPAGAPQAPPWVQGRLLRALVRTQHAFALVANLDDLAERYEDALSPVSEFVEQLLDQGSSLDARTFRLSMLADAEECLREILETAIDVRDIRALAEAVFEAENEVNLALMQQADSPLQLSTRTRSIQL